MNIPNAPASYDASNEREFRRVLEAEDFRNLKRDQNIELQGGAVVVLISPNGARYALSVADDGTPETTAL